MSREIALLLIAGSALVALLLSRIQAGINARHGTDHAVHVFLINRIRENNYRLFVRIPRLLNEAYIGALPLYLHWIFSLFPLRVMPVAEKLLNPTMNALLVMLVGIASLKFAFPAAPGTAALAAGLVSVTPQFYHALSARNFGLSARSIGLVLFAIFFFLAWRIIAGSDNWSDWALLGVSSYLVFGFSTFGAQALVIVGLLVAVLTASLVTLFGTLMGLAIFVIVHPRYALGYLQHTARFIAAYGRELAPVYILARRYSIWRDFTRDIWVKLSDGPKAAFRYAYENSILVVLLLNPLVVLAAALHFLYSQTETISSLTGFARVVSLAGIGAMLLTSFRQTRFLGEPERYVEAVTPFAAIGSAGVLLEVAGGGGALALILFFTTLCVAQIVASRILSKYLSSKPVRMDDVQAAILRHDAGRTRLASNNEQYLKLLLVNDWRFSYCIAVGNGYCGMRIGEVFDPLPFVRREALARIVTAYRIDTCVLDRSFYETVFDHAPSGLQQTSTIFESDGVVVLRFKWDYDDAPPRGA